MMEVKKLTEELDEKILFKEKPIYMYAIFVVEIIMALGSLFIFYKNYTIRYLLAIGGLIVFFLMVLSIFVSVLSIPAEPFQVLKNGIGLSTNYYEKKIKKKDRFRSFDDISKISIAKYKKKKYKPYPILSLYRWEFYIVKIYFKNKEWDLVYLRNGHSMLSTLKSAMGEDDFSKVYDGNIPINDGGVKA